MPRKGEKAEVPAWEKMTCRTANIDMPKLGGTCIIRSPWMQRVPSVSATRCARGRNMSRPRSERVRSNRLLHSRQPWCKRGYDETQKQEGDRLRHLPPDSRLSIGQMDFPVFQDGFQMVRAPYYFQRLVQVRTAHDTCERVLMESVGIAVQHNIYIIDI